MNLLKLARPPALIKCCLAFLVVAAVILRFYHFKDTFLFLGDQGRDSLIARSILLEHELVFIGPITSVGNLYLGPFYYYFMVPFLALTYPSPIGPGLAVAAISVITVYLMYALGQEMVGKRAALLAAFFYAFSAPIVQYSRFSWNPNITAPVTLLLIWCLWRAWKKNIWYWLGVSICFSILIQLHYIALSTLGGIGIIWLLHLHSLWQAHKPAALKRFAISSGIAALIFLLSLTPLALFNYKHHGAIVTAFLDLLFKEKVFSHDTPSNLVDVVRTNFGLLLDRTEIVLFRFSLVSDVKLGLWMVAIFVLGLAVLIQKKLTQNVVMLLSLLVPCLVGFALYKGDLYVHYFLFVLPMVFFLWGLLLASASRHLWGWLIVAGFMIAFLAFNIPRMPFKGYGVTIDNIQAFSQEILSHLKPNEKYVILLLSGTKDYYGSNYRYYFTTLGRPPLSPEFENVADTLVVINEDAVQDIPHLDMYEINIFPNKVPSEVYTIPQGPQVLIFRR